VQIVLEAKKRKIYTSGTVNDIRRRLNRYLDEHPKMPGTNLTQNMVQARHASHSADIAPSITPTGTSR